MRTDGRASDQLREVKINPEINRHAEGSVTIEMGNTIVYCTASIESKIPKWLMNSKQGWVTAEYGMLPRSTHQRITRDKVSKGGRSQEISRLIGRSLRAAVDLKLLGERQVFIDCDVLQADGGTRTASITGGFVALCLALKFLKDQKQIKDWPIKHYVSAISVGLKGEEALLDLNYDEDSTISTDMNFVMNSEEKFIEIQGTAEEAPFSQKNLSNMIEYADKGCQELFKEQNKVLKDFFSLSECMTKNNQTNNSAKTNQSTVRA